MLSKAFLFPCQVLTAKYGAGFWPTTTWTAICQRVLEAFRGQVETDHGSSCTIGRVCVELIGWKALASQSVEEVSASSSQGDHLFWVPIDERKSRQPALCVCRYIRSLLDSSVLVSSPFNTCLVAEGMLHFLPCLICILSLLEEFLWIRNMMQTPPSCTPHFHWLQGSAASPETKKTIVFLLWSSFPQINWSPPSMTMQSWCQGWSIGGCKSGCIPGGLLRTWKDEFRNL